MKIRFTFDKFTKNCVRYVEDAEEPIVGTFYLQKSAAEELGDPDVIIVTVEAADDDA